MKIRNREKFIEGVKTGKYTIKNASKELLQDESVLLLCASFSSEPIINKIPKQFLNKTAFLRDLVATSPVNFVSLQDMQFNREFILSVCERNDQVAKYIPTPLCNDYNFVKQMVSANGYALNHIHNNMRYDREINYLAIKSRPFVFKNLSEEFKNDFGLAKLAVSERAENFFSLNEELSNNEAIVTAALQASSTYAYHIYKNKISDELRATRDVATAACKSNLTCLVDVPTDTFLSTGFKRDLAKIIDRRERSIANGKDDEFDNVDEFKEYLSGLLDEKREIMMQEQGFSRAGAQAVSTNNFSLTGNEAGQTTFEQENE